MDHGEKIPAGVPDDPTVREEERLRSLMAADPDLAVFHVRLRERDDIPYLVISPTPSPELLQAQAADSEGQFFGPVDLDVLAQLRHTPGIQQAVSPLALILASMIWAKLEGAFVKPLELEGRIEIEDEDGHPWGHVLIHRGGRLELFDTGGRWLSGWPPGPSR